MSLHDDGSPSSLLRSIVQLRLLSSLINHALQVNYERKHAHIHWACWGFGTEWATAPVGYKTLNPLAEWMSPLRGFTLAFGSQGNMVMTWEGLKGEAIACVSLCRTEWKRIDEERELINCFNSQSSSLGLTLSPPCFLSFSFQSVLLCLTVVALLANPHYLRLSPSLVWFTLSSTFSRPLSSCLSP